ncbi:MAG TPA: hypothetical protein VLJ17_24460 [Xanthobacteraceae bacterium]|nr:hypothetical protein [Xanthobacteraceae bacterium]
MLTYYETQTQRLLQNPAATKALYATSDLDSWINTARGQLAGETETIRAIGTLLTVPGTRSYPFSAIQFGGSPAQTGIQGTLNVRRVGQQIGVGPGLKFLFVRSWEWFDHYHLNSPNPQVGPPVRWAQFGQGGSGTGSITGIGAGTAVLSGSLLIDPIPDIQYTLSVDCVCYPQALAADTDIEAIPYLFTDAVPFFAAYYALLSAQTNARLADAERYFGHYETFVERARKATNSSVARTLFEQASDMSQAAKFGAQAKAAGA